MDHDRPKRTARHDVPPTAASADPAQPGTTDPRASCRACAGPDRRPRAAAARLAGVVGIAGSAVAVLAVAFGDALALGGDATLVPVFVGAGVWIVAMAAAPGIRSWRTERNQAALGREYAADDACTHPSTSP